MGFSIWNIPFLFWYVSIVLKLYVMAKYKSLYTQRKQRLFYLLVLLRGIHAVHFNDLAALNPDRRVVRCKVIVCDRTDKEIAGID